MRFLASLAMAAVYGGPVYALSLAALVGCFMALLAGCEAAEAGGGE